MKTLITALLALTSLTASAQNQASQVTTPKEVSKANANVVERKRVCDELMAKLNLAKTEMEAAEKKHIVSKSMTPKDAMKASDDFSRKLRVFLAVLEEQNRACDLHDYAQKDAQDLQQRLNEKKQYAVQLIERNCLSIGEKVAPETIKTVMARLLTMHNDYIRNRMRACQWERATFEFDGATYYTKTGFKKGK